MLIPEWLLLAPPAPDASSIFEMEPGTSNIALAASCREKQIFVDNLVVRVHLIIEMILVDHPYATGV